MQKKEKEIEECFHLYDYPKKGRVPNSKLMELMNALGQNATQAEMNDLVHKADPENQGSFTLEGFRRVMKEYNTVSYTNSDLRSAYDLLDRDGDGYISKQDLRNASKLLLGAPLEDDKIEFMYKNLKVEDNKITFEQFLKLLN